MSDLEKETFRKIGIDLINEYRVRGGFKPIDWLVIDTPEVSAFIRSIQLHEKTKNELRATKKELADFRQEVSDVIYKSLTSIVNGCAADAAGDLSRFIIPKPKPDPLAQILGSFDGTLWEPEDVSRFHAALNAAGLEIREKNDD